ncbi:MAG: cobalamin-dependent protein [Methanomassiliicoccales archaeon]
MIKGDAEGAVEAAKKALATKMDAYEVMQKGAALAMDVVSYLYDEKVYYLPEALVAANAFYAAADVLQPHIKAQEGGPKASIVLGVIEGDIHDIGKNLVKVRLSAGGMTVYDVGRDTPIDTFIETAQKNNANLIGLSTMMTPTMLGFEALIEVLKEKGLRDKFLVAVGGGPVSEEFAKKIGADGFAKNATEASSMLANAIKEKEKTGKMPGAHGKVIRGG